MDLAGRFGAALIGISGYSYVPSFLAGGSAAKAGRQDSDYQEMLGALADCGAKFRDLAKHARKVEWRGKVESANELVAREARAADLIIVGSKGLSGIERAVLGSVSEKVVREAGCTVEVARAKTYDYVPLLEIIEVDHPHKYVAPHRYTYEDHRVSRRPNDWPLY